ncbi:AroM family protein [Rhizobiaceae bacterium BDR2-2]|uniref:AroM family protein n=1 Tax=Ectorhizobium quercum TaxID=2965071 RepID=A0AAE3MVV1_9HYPH|nr:AroM family protein [Ectorhizobium quercum]MCX8995824.1 AroM family protein [Ectorhizobium quercum]
MTGETVRESSGPDDAAQATPDRPHRVMFVSVGQSPRRDLIDEMLKNLDVPIEALEIGALDGLSAQHIDALRVRPGETSIISRLADGSDIVLSKPRIGERMAEIVAAFSPKQYDLVVMLSTGLFRDFESTCPTVNAQRAIESAIISLAAHGAVVGLIQPLEQQIHELDIPALSPYRVLAAYGREGDRSLLARALMDLSGSEIIVLNSVSFTEADRETVARASGKPVVLARRIVASAIRLLLHDTRPVALPGISSEFMEKLARLTPRERQVMSLVAEGLSNKAIARQLGISPKTVEIHRSNLMGKMEVSSSSALIRLVIGAGWS